MTSSTSYSANPKDPAPCTQLIFLDLWECTYEYPDGTYCRRLIDKGDYCHVHNESIKDSCLWNDRECNTPTVVSSSQREHCLEASLNNIEEKMVTLMSHCSQNILSHLKAS